MDAKQIVPKYGLRDYQRQVVRDAWNSVAGRKRARVIVHLPTGAGKTRVATALVSRLMIDDQTANGTFMWLATAEELCEQAADALSRAWKSLGDRSLSVTRFSGGSRAALIDAPPGFLVCSLPKLWATIGQGKGELPKFARRVAGVVFDEAHQAVATTYAAATSQLSAWTAPVIGLTATPGRHAMDPEASEQLAEFFNRTKVTIDPGTASNPVEFLMREGYLAVPRVHPIERDGLAPQESANDKDYGNEIHEVLGQMPGWLDAVREAVDDALRRCRRIIVFAPSVSSAALLAEEYRSKARSSVAVVAGTEAGFRSSAVEEFRTPPQSADDRRLLFNFAVFTAGFDAPATDAVIIGQPTKSLVRYSQMVGRALRGPESGGERECHVYTITDSNLPGFASVIDAFQHWEDLWT